MHSDAISRGARDDRGRGGERPSTSAPRGAWPRPPSSTHHLHHHHHHRPITATGATNPSLSLAATTTHSPSALRGIASSAEIEHRAKASSLLRTTTTALQMPTPCAIAAWTMALRFYAKHPVDAHDVLDVVSTCVYIASKLEECPRRISDIVNVAWRVLRPKLGDPESIAKKFGIVGATSAAAAAAAEGETRGGGGHGEAAANDALEFMKNATDEEKVAVKNGAAAAAQAKAAAAFAAAMRKEETGETTGGKPVVAQNAASASVTDATEPSVYVGEAYYQAKDRVLELEQEVLRCIDYALNVPQPHKYLLNMCAAVRAPPRAAQFASVTLTDAAFHTTLLLRYRAGEIAAAALRLSGMMHGLESRWEAEYADARRRGGDTGGGGGAGGGWWTAFGYDARVLDDIGWEMMDVLERTPAPEAAAAAAVKAE